MELRKAAVAGLFYEQDFEKLERQMKECFLHERGPGSLPSARRTKNVRAVIAPHAGYRYSGPCLAWAFKELAESRFADTYVVIGTNHSAYPYTTTTRTDWQTPLGVVRVDQELAHEIIKRKIAVDDVAPHLQEHSIEVQLPFLQLIAREHAPKLKFLPLMLAPDLSVRDFALDLQEVLLDSGKRTAFIISADFTHYGPNYHYLPFTEHVQQKLYNLDMGAIELISSLNGKAFFDYVHKGGVTICGHLPITLLLECVGKTKPKLLQYYTSGDVTNDWKNAVGYAAMSFSE